MNQQILFVIMSLFSYHRLFIKVYSGLRAQTLALKQHKHFRIMNALMTVASCLILAKYLRWFGVHVLGLWLRGETDTGSQQELGETTVQVLSQDRAKLKIKDALP